MSQTVNGILRILAISLLLVVAPVANSQYLSDTDAQRKAASEKNAVKQKKIDAVVGKTFWYRPGNSDASRIEFYEKAGPMRVGSSYIDILEFTGKFYLTKETSFKVLEADFKKLKVEFEDGKTAFLKAYILAEHGEYSLLERLYTGRDRANNYQAYIYPDVPFKIENPALFVALDSILGRKFWYRPTANASVKLNFVGEVKAETAFVIEGYTISADTINIKLQLVDNAVGTLQIEKSMATNFTGSDLPFIYVSKDKYVSAREYLYAGPPSEVIAAEEAAFAASATSAAQAKAVADEDRSRARQDASAVLTKELKGVPRSFEVRGLFFGKDHYLEVSESKGFQSGKGADVDGFPDTHKEISTDGATLYFYRGILFMATYEDLQDTIEIRAAMNQLEAKLKGKFAKLSQQKSRDGNIETTTGGFRLNIGTFGVAEVKLTSSRPINRRTCIDDIAREMRQRIALRLSNYSSLSDRVESECRETLNPTQLVFINKPIEALVNSRATAEQKANARQAAEEKVKAASEKAKTF